MGQSPFQVCGRCDRGRGKKVNGAPAATKEGKNDERIQAKAAEVGALTAQIILKLNTLEKKLTFEDHKKNFKVLQKVEAFSEHNNETISFRVYKLLLQLVELVGTNTPIDLVGQIVLTARTFYPSGSKLADGSWQTELGIAGTEIGFAIAYDALFVTKNFQVAKWGLHLLNLYYLDRFNGKNRKVKEAVLYQYKQLEMFIQNEDPKLMVRETEFVAIFQNDLKKNSRDFPYLPEHLQN
jgi:hypothetical protein